MHLNILLLNPYPADHHYCRLLFVFFVDQIIDIENKEFAQT